MTSGLLLAALVATAATSRGRGIRTQALLAVVAALWLLVMPAGMEGHILLSLRHGMGLTEGDLSGLTGIVIAAWRSLRLMRDHRRQGL